MSLNPVCGRWSVPCPCRTSPQPDGTRSRHSQPFHALLASPLGLILTLALLAGLCLSAPRSGLDIYFVDTEGGAATLIVTPARESVLIDDGNPGERDALRIRRAAAIAGLRAIDHLIITHWHLDHYGGTAALAKLIRVRHFWDRGIVPDSESDDPQNYPALIRAYKAASRGRSRTLRAGDTLPLRQTRSAPIQVLTLCASGQVVPDSAGAPANPLAREFKVKPPDLSDNARSLGFRLSFGDFRFLDLGDLTWNMEENLVDPTDKIGAVDVFQTSHHGLDVSNNPVLIKTIQPRVAVCNNGPHKGAMPAVIATLRALRSTWAVYQQHKNLDAPTSANAAPECVANPAEDCNGEFIHLSVAPDSRTYTIQIGEHGPMRVFRTREKLP